MILKLDSETNSFILDMEYDNVTFEPYGHGRIENGVVKDFNIISVDVVYHPTDLSCKPKKELNND